MVRQDLSPEQQSVQACHAALEMARFRYLPTHPHIVLLGVPSVEHLRQVQEKLTTQKSIPFRIFLDSDHTIPFTAIATEPIGADLRTFFRQYKLLKMKG